MDKGDSRQVHVPQTGDLFPGLSMVSVQVLLVDLSEKRAFLKVCLLFEKAEIFFVDPSLVTLYILNKLYISKSMNIYTIRT